MKEWFLDRIDDTLRDILRGSSIVFVLKVAGAGLAFAFNIVLARLLGAEGTGAYFLSLTVLTVGSIVGRLGLDEVFVRRVAADSDQGRWGRVRGVHRTGIMLATGLACGVAVVLFFGAPWIAEYGFGNTELAEPIALMGLAVVPLVLSRLYSQILKALKKIVVFTLIQKQGILVPGLSIVGTYVLCGWLGWEVEGAVWAFIGSAVVATFVGVYVWRRAVPDGSSSVQQSSWRDDGSTESVSVGSLTRPGIPLFWVETLGFLRNQAGLLLLGVWVTEAEVGIYGTALRVALLTSFVLVAINSIVSPQIASLYESGSREKLDQVARYAVKISTLLATPPLLLFVLAPDFVLSLFGSEFKAGAVPLIILAIAQFLNVSTGPVGYLLIMTGREKQMRNVDLVATSVGIVLYLTLIPPYGAAGAAVAYGTAISVRYLGAAFTVARSLNITLFGPLEIINDVMARLRA